MKKIIAYIVILLLYSSAGYAKTCVDSCFISYKICIKKDITLDLSCYSRQESCTQACINIHGKEINNSCIINSNNSCRQAILSCRNTPYQSRSGCINQTVDGCKKLLIQCMDE